MAIPTPLHYWLVRLRALNRPVIWGSGLGLLLLGLVVQQYFSHPEWLRGFTPNEADPSRSTEDLSDLSQEELANLAEIDNLGLLLDQLQPRTASALSETPDPNTEAPNATLREPRPTPLAASADGSSPFAAYLERTQFRVSSLTPAGSNAAATPEERGLGRPRFGQTAIPDDPVPSPLQQLLAPAQPATTPETTPRSSMANTNTLPPTGPTTSPNASPTTGLTPPPWAVEGATPGVNQPFIRTTPEMSPPPGTTGYRPPASLPPAPNTLPNANLGLPAPTAAPLNLSPGAASSSIPSPTTPSRVGNTLPPSGSSGYTDPYSVPEAAPFSAPRPPGSHIGGGYIHTFSNPNGPED